MSLGKESSISVTVRVRPFTENELSHLQKESEDPVFLGGGSLVSNRPPPMPLMGSRAGIRKVINVVDDKMLIFDPPQRASRVGSGRFPLNNTARIREHRFVFDRLFDDSASQEDVYSNTTRPLLDSVLDGYNATVFAYGATGCGKTHTISGTPQAPGIIFLTMKELFERIADIRDTQLVDVSLSYLEIYNETIKDLLQPSNKQLVLREDSDHRISVSNLSTHKPENVEAVMDMILHGNSNRTISPTEANATSSRSHAVLQINVVQKGRTASLSQAHTFATLSIIDLAGSERASATKNRGDRLLEGANINKSLLALGNCINALCDPRRRNHIPYRDSKLTRLLKFSLGGNCKTVMIVCVSPSSKHYDETLNTLKYADRAKKIKTKVIRNEHNLDRHVGSYLKMITEQKAEIEELRQRESKAVSIALANAEKAQKRCLHVLEDAVASLHKTFSQATEAQEKKAKALQQLHNIMNQICQVECILSSFEGASLAHSALTTTFPGAIKQALDKLRREKESLERYIANVTNDKHTLDVAVASLTRRLEDTPGWTDANRTSFRAQAAELMLQSEVRVLDQVVNQPVSTSIVTTFSDLFFNMVGKLGTLVEGMDPELMAGELRLMTDEVVAHARNQLNQIASNSPVEPIVFSGVKRPAQSSPARPRVSRPSIIPTASPANLPSMTPAYPSSATVAASARRISLGMGNPLASRRPGSAKKLVVNRSPLRIQRKAAKRVRWEDDSDMSMESAGTPFTPMKSSADTQDLDSLSLPSPPELAAAPIQQASPTKQSPRPTAAPMQPVLPSYYNLPPIASTPVGGPGKQAHSPIKLSSLRFGVKGELRRKSVGGPRASLIPGGLPPMRVSPLDGGPPMIRLGSGAGQVSLNVGAGRSPQRDQQHQRSASMPDGGPAMSPVGAAGNRTGLGLGAPARISIAAATTNLKDHGQRRNE